MQLQLAFLDSLPQIHLELPTVIDAFIHGSIVEAMRPARARLDRIERQIGRHEQVLGIVPVPRSNGDSDADPRADAVPIDLVGMIHRRNQPVGKGFERASRSGRGHHDGKFIAAKARQNICGPQGLLQTHGDLLQQHVPDPVTQGVVDDLEAVDIKEEDRKFRIRRSR